MLGLFFTILVTVAAFYLLATILISVIAGEGPSPAIIKRLLRSGAIIIIVTIPLIIIATSYSVNTSLVVSFPLAVISFTLQLKNAETRPIRLLGESWSPNRVGLMILMAISATYTSTSFASEAMWMFGIMLITTMIGIFVMTILCTVPSESPCKASD